MSAQIDVRVQVAAFDAAHEADALTAGRRDIGALVTFTGLCRDESGTLAALHLEHYPGMAEAEVLAVAQEAARRFPIFAMTVIHRSGRIVPGEPIVFVAATSAHRAAAFSAADFLMDYLKTSAPFWKKEQRADGANGGWVAAKESDDAAAARWDKME